MRRIKGRMTLCITAIALLLLFIWGNSCLPGKLSGALSGWLSELLGLMPSDPPTGHGILRKLAHFTEFALLGVCLCWLFGMLGKPFPIPLLCGFLVACTDEIIQCVIPDRGPAFTDVLIDTAGVAVGIGLLLGVFVIYKKKNQLQYLEETKL